MHPYTFHNTGAETLRVNDADLRGDIVFSNSAIKMRREQTTSLSQQNETSSHIEEGGESYR
jgi:hypothetical protein